MELISLYHTSTKFFRIFPLTLNLLDLNRGNNALSPLINKYHQTINLGTVDLMFTFDILQRSSYLTSLDISDTYKVYRPNFRYYQRSYTRPDIDLQESLKYTCLYLSLVIIKT